MSIDTDTPGAGATVDLPDAPAIPGLRFRRPRAGDRAGFEAMAAVTCASNLADLVEYIPTAQQLEDDLTRSHGLDLGSDVILAEVGDRLVAWAYDERSIRGGEVVYELDGFVLPELRGRGIGTALLAENLRRVADRAAAASDTDAAVQTHVDDTQTGKRAVVEAAGLQPVRWFFLMRRATLDDIPDAPLPEGLSVRPVALADRDAIIAAEQEAFRDHWGWLELTPEDIAIVFGRAELDTDLWVVAWDGDQVAGVVQNWIWPSENAAVGAQRGWLEHISVRRAWRRRGLARALTAESLRRLRDAGMTEALLGVDADNPTGALRLYEGLGFEIYQRGAAYRRALAG